MKTVSAFLIGLLVGSFTLHANVLPGNGVIVDSAATDYYNHTSQDTILPSLYNDVENNPDANIQYIFPDVGYITMVADPAITADIEAYVANSKNTFDASKIKITVMAEQFCTSSVVPRPTMGSDRVIVYYSFCAQPQIKRLDPNDYVPFKQPDLGGAVELSSLATYYQSFSSTTNTVPFINYDTDWTSMLYAVYNNGGSAEVIKSMQTLADNISKSITKSENIYGVGFDNEPSIGKTDTQDGLSSTIALNFFKSIAQQIGPDKTLFLFDANSTAKALFTTEGVKNIVVLYPLYDFETQNTEGPPYPISPNGPYALSSYRATSGTNVNHTAENGLYLGVPLMFVIPASATSTLWDRLQAYNSQSVTPPNLVITTDVIPAKCNNNLDSDEVEQNILSVYLCTQAGTCPGGAAALSQYLQLGAPNSPGCAAYRNHVGEMISYFEASLAAISGVQAKQNPMYLGTVLYTWRIPSYADFACASHFYNVHSDSAKQCNQVLPADIGKAIWAAFSKWNRQ